MKDRVQGDLMGETRDRAIINILSKKSPDYQQGFKTAIMLADADPKTYLADLKKRSADYIDGFHRGLSYALKVIQEKK